MLSGKPGTVLDDDLRRGAHQLQGLECEFVNIIDKVIDHGAVIIAEHTVSAYAFIPLRGLSEQDDGFSEVIAFFLITAAVAYYEIGLDYQFDKAEIIVTLS